MAKIVKYLDCGCGVFDNGAIAECKSCSAGVTDWKSRAESAERREREAAEGEASTKFTLEPRVRSVCRIDPEGGQMSGIKCLRVSDGRFCFVDGFTIFTFSGLQVWPAWCHFQSCFERDASHALDIEAFRAAYDAMAAGEGEKKCSYTGSHFGATYEDAICIDGYLWDADSNVEDGGPLTSGGDIPCPECNAGEYYKRIAEDLSEQLECAQEEEKDLKSALSAAEATIAGLVEALAEVHDGLTEQCGQIEIMDWLAEHGAAWVDKTRKALAKARKE